MPAYCKRWPSCRCHKWCRPRSRQLIKEGLRRYTEDLKLTADVACIWVKKL